MTQIVGTGPNLALIHGWGLGNWVWQPLLEPLSRRCRLHLVNLPGYGPAPADQADFATTAGDMLNALPAGVTLCGWSLGATLAMRAALLAPERVAGLILVGSTARFTRQVDWPAAQAPDLLDSFLVSVRDRPEQTLQRFVALLSQGDAQSRTITRTLLAGLRQGPTPDSTVLTHGLEWLRDVDLRPLAQEITTRCLLVHGENDPLNPLAAAKWLSEKLPTASLEIFPDTGHAPFVADPDRFVRLVDNFCHAPAA